MPACPKTPESRWGRVADNTSVNVSVLIPTRGRPARLAACLRGLAGQDWLPGDEVVIGLDHVFAHQKNRFGLFIRTIGMERARVKIGVANIAYNLTRYVWHQGRSVPA